MKIPSLIFSAIGVVAFIAGVMPCPGETVAEWKFEGRENLGGGHIVPLDLTASSASSQSLLMSDASYAASSTGLGDKWQPFLGAGYLDAGARSGKDSAGACGLVTKNTALPEEKIYPGGDASYRAYMGFKGLGEGSAPVVDGADRSNGGTVYLIISPASGWTGSRCGLMGTGHIGGCILLSAANGEISLRVGTVGSGGQTASATVPGEWAPDKWYFIAGSWTAGQPPILMVREMDPAGPAASPPALNGLANGPAPQGLSQPEYDPIVIGAQWINTGADTSRYTQDGANARIAYARIDNIYSSVDDMANVFESLGAK